MGRMQLKWTLLRKMVFERKFQIAVHIWKANILFGATFMFRVVGKILIHVLELEKLSL